MRALLSEEQEMLKRMVSQMAASAHPASTSDLATVDREKVWSSLADAQLLALRVRDGEGVPAASGVEVMLVCEALGHSLCPVPYLGGILAGDLMSRAGAPVSWVDELASGETRYGLLMAPDLGRLADPIDPDLVAADRALAFDVDDAAYVVGLSGAGIVRASLRPAFSPVEPADLTRRVERLESPDSLTVDSAGALRAEDLDAWLAMALVAVSADLVGVMSSALTKAVDYAKERVQYGVKIGSFQAVQHMCADALVQIEASASATRFAAWAVDALDTDEALLAARVAKAYSSSSAREVTETVMQVFGGIGQTWEHIAHVHTRRALTDRALFGDESEQLDRIADTRLGAPLDRRAREA
jgi:alkylation response protein AidB-like acyl-CoA dehydrogenase